MSNYPAFIDTSEVLYVAVNNKHTSLVGAITAGATSIAILDATNLQPANGIISIGIEVIKYTSIDVGGANPVLLGCTRGFDGTPASAHSSGTRVDVRWVAAHHNGLAAAIIAIQTELGTTPGGAFANLAERLDLNLPLIVPMSLSNDWSFTHNRKRIVGIQLWAKNGSNNYEIFEAGIEQELNITGAAQVDILLGAGNDREGYMVVT